MRQNGAMDDEGGRSSTENKVPELHAPMDTTLQHGQDHSYRRCHGSHR
jgi:hypothetical protein